MTFPQFDMERTRAKMKQLLLAEYEGEKAAQELAKIDALDAYPYARWQNMCAMYRAEALQILIEAGLVTKTDLPDGSATLDFVGHDHPEIVS
jgi:hypothetical protein